MSTFAASPQSGGLVAPNPAAEPTPEFQLKILAMAVRDGRFAQSLGPLLRPELFASLQLGIYTQVLASWVQHWVLTYGKQSPTLPRYVCEQWITAWMNSQTQNRDYHSAMWARLVWEIYDCDIPAPNYVRDAAMAWIQKREQMALLLEAKRALDKGTAFEEISLLPRLREIDALPRKLQGLGMGLGFDPSTEFGVASTSIARDVLPTGLKRFDEAMNGGAARKELLVIAAPPNTAKTTVCCDLSARWMRQGKFVVYYTCEQAAPQIFEKHIATTSGASIHALRQHPAVLQSWLEYIYRGGGRLLIQEYPTGKGSVEDIYAHLSAVRATYGRLPDVVVVDYADLLRSSAKYDQLRHTLTAIYVDLRGLAVENNLLVVTPTQTNRSSVNEEIITIDYLSEAFDKAAIADVIVALCQTEAEQQQDMMRFFFAKNRHGRKFVTIPYRISFELARLEEQEKAQLAGQQANYGMLLAQQPNFKAPNFLQTFRGAVA